MPIPIASGNFTILVRFFGVEWRFDTSWASHGSSVATAIWGSDDGLIAVATGTGIRHGQYPSSTYYTAPLVTSDSYGNPLHIDGLSRTQIWIAHTTGVLAWNDTTSNYDAVHTFSSTTRASVAAFADDDVWVQTDSELWYYNGSTWTDVSGALPETFTSLVKLRKVGTTLYLLMVPTAVTYGRVYKYTGSWSLVATDSIASPQTMWVDADDDLWLAFNGGANLLPVRHWDGAAWTAISIPTETLYETTTVTDLVSISPGHIYASYERGSGTYGGIGEAHVTSSGLIVKRSETALNHEIHAMSTVGTSHYGATYTDGSVDADGRMILNDALVRDVKVIHPSQDAMFGQLGSNFTGRRYDGRAARDGTLVDGTDISFGTVAGGVNENAWAVETDGVPPYLNYDFSSAGTSTVSIPSDGQINLSIANASAGSGTINSIISSNGLWAIPGNTDFVLTLDFSLTVDLTVDEAVFLYPRLYASNNSYQMNEEDGDPYNPGAVNYWGMSYRCGFWLSRGEVIDTAYINNTNHNSGYRATTIKTTHPTRARFTKTGSSITMEWWDPAAASGSGAWMTYAHSYSGDASEDWQNNTPRFFRFILSGDGNAGRKQTADITITSMTLTGCTPITYDDTHRLWRPFEQSQGELQELPSNPSGLILDRRGFSITDLTTGLMNWKAPRRANNSALLPAIDINAGKNDSYITDRIDYHEGLVGVVARDGTSTWLRADANTVSRFTFVDFSESSARHIQPDDDTSTNPGQSGAVYMRNETTNLPTGWSCTRGLLSPEIRDRLDSTTWGAWGTVADSLPWRAYAGDPRDVAVYREGIYAYYVGASEGGLFFTQHAPLYEYHYPTANPYTTNSAHTTTYQVEVIAVSVDKGTGNMFWLTAAGAFYYAAKATWQAMGETTPNASYYESGFTHSATTTFSGTLSRRSQERIATLGTEAYIAADEGIYRSDAGGSFALYYGASGATHQILPSGTTSVDAVSTYGDYITAACYNSTSQETTLVVIRVSTNAIAYSQDITDEVGGLGKRATSVAIGVH